MAATKYKLDNEFCKISDEKVINAASVHKMRPHVGLLQNALSVIQASAILLEKRMSQTIIAIDVETISSSLFCQCI